MIAIGIGAYAWQRDRTRESDRVDGLLRLSGQEYSKAQQASIRTNWDEVRRIASGVASRLEPESDPLLANLRAMADNLDAMAGSELSAQHALQRKSKLVQRPKLAFASLSRLETKRFFSTRGSAVWISKTRSRPLAGRPAPPWRCLGRPPRVMSGCSADRHRL